MAKVSVILPARNEPYLQKTVEDCIQKAKGEVEIIAVLDGYWPDPPLPDYKQLILLHRPEAEGMRAALNSAARIATGKYLMKLDAHCMIGEHYDTILQENCEKDWLVVPSRYSLDAENWKVRDGKWKAVEYNFLTFPYQHDDQYGTGMHAKKLMGPTGASSYYAPEAERKDKKIDDIMTWQGSCWFMHREKFFEIDCLDTVHCFNIHQEAQELGFKIWLGSHNGRMIVNKNTWYAHWHKSNKDGRGFRLSYDAMRTTERTMTWFWMNDKWPKQVRPFRWLVEKFWPIEGWPENWEEVKAEHEKTHPELWAGKDIRVFDPKGHDGLGLLTM